MGSFLLLVLRAPQGRLVFAHKRVRGHPHITGDSGGAIVEHTLDSPYCSNSDCWCHRSSSYHATFTTGRELEWDEVKPQDIVLAIELLGEYAQQPTYDWQVQA